MGERRVIKLETISKPGTMDMNGINFAYLHFIFLNDKIRTEKVTNVKKN